MGREIRRVPADWQHPKDERGQYQPMFDRVFEDAAAEWDAEKAQWGAGTHPDQLDQTSFGVAARACADFTEWHGNRPKPHWYRPAFASEPTHYQMYENVSEGTPFSPVFATEDDLVAWLMTQGYGEDAARGFVAKGSAPSFVMLQGDRDTTTIDGVTAAGLDC